MRYKIVRFFFKEDVGLAARTVRRGLTLEEAQRWCKDPETSSRTAQSAKAKRRTREYGPWFDGYTEE